MNFRWHLKLIIILPQFSRHFHIFLCLNSHNSLSLLPVTGNPSDHTVSIAKKKKDLAVLGRFGSGKQALMKSLEGQ